MVLDRIFQVSFSLHSGKPLLTCLLGGKMLRFAYGLSFNLTEWTSWEEKFQSTQTFWNSQSQTVLSFSYEISSTVRSLNYWLALNQKGSALK